MPDTITDRGGVVVLHLAADGMPVASEQDATDLIGQAFGQGADLVVLPVGRLDERFFQLRSGLAGQVVQKFVNYRLRLAIIGDIDGHVAASTALRDFVTESNRGRHLWFVPDDAALDAALSRRG